MLNVLSLCSGVGGIELGLRLATAGRARTVAYVEREAYVAACLRARMADGLLDDAPIYSDLRSFDGRPWRGKVDLIAGGYPCQPFSAAGKRLGAADPRHLWPEFVRLLEETGAPAIFCENVRGHVSKGLREVLGDLARLGFDAEWDVFSAEEEGAPHRRQRLFIYAWMADTAAGRPQGGCESLPGGAAPTGELSGADEPTGESAGECGGSVAHPDLDAGGERRARVAVEGAGGWDAGRGSECEDVPEHRHPSSLRGQGNLGSQPQPVGGRPEREMARTPSPRGWWSAEPNVGRVAHGVAARVDRLRACGNGVVPAVACRAWRELTRRALA